jgi:ribosomal protein S4
MEYLLQQKIKNFYVISQTEFSNLSNLSHLYNLNLFVLIESRIDVLLCRSLLAVSIYQAREFIKRGLVSIDNKICSHPNELVTVGSEFKLNSVEAAHNLLHIQNTFKNEEKLIPNYILFKKFNCVVFKYYPNLKQIPFPLSIPAFKFPS